MLIISSELISVPIDISAASLTSASTSSGSTADKSALLMVSLIPTGYGQDEL